MPQTSTSIRKLAQTTVKVGLNKYNPNEMIGQAINLFDDERYGLGREGHAIAEQLRDVARKAEQLWRERER